MKNHKMMRFQVITAAAAGGSVKTFWVVASLQHYKMSQPRETQSKSTTPF
jgi:hypothetical protein